MTSFNCPLFPHYDDTITVKVNIENALLHPTSLSLSLSLSLSMNATDFF